VEFIAHNVAEKRKRHERHGTSRKWLSNALGRRNHPVFQIVFVVLNRICFFFGWFSNRRAPCEKARHNARIGAKQALMSVVMQLKVFLIQGYLLHGNSCYLSSFGHFIMATVRLPARQRPVASLRLSSPCLLPKSGTNKCRFIAEVAALPFEALQPLLMRNR
jgi:hypothetical protein